MNQVPKFCSNCGHPLELNDRFCGQCGHAVEKPENKSFAETRSTLQNTSGQGRSTEVPAEIKRWNWGAFFLNWLWGFGNRTYIALLCLIPLLNIVMIFVLGAKGSEWAWRNKQWESIDTTENSDWDIDNLIVAGDGSNRGVYAINRFGGIHRLDQRVAGVDRMVTFIGEEADGINIPASLFVLTLFDIVIKQPSISTPLTPDAIVMALLKFPSIIDS